MIHHGYIRSISFQDQKDVGGASGKAIRAKSARDDPDGMDIVEQQDTVQEALDALDSCTDTDDFPGLVLRITLDPKVFRSATSGDRKF